MIKANTYYSLRPLPIYDLRVIRKILTETLIWVAASSGWVIFYLGCYQPRLFTDLIVRLAL